MAKNGWFPHTDSATGQKTGWFGKNLPKSAPNAWNPLVTFSPTPTPQLSKEYIYAGSRLLAVEDTNATAVWPADLAIWRPSSGNWTMYDGTNDVTGEGTTYQWGATGDVPTPGDYDADGKTDFAVFRPSNTFWYISNSSNASVTYFAYGSSSDIPAPADYDGDGKTDVAAFRPSDGNWYIIPSSTGTSNAPFTFGQSGDIPAPADYDGDGKADICYWRYGTTSQFHIKRSSDGQTQTVDLGSASTDKPVSADYDGDGKADFALLGGNVWTILQSSTNTITTVTWGSSGDVPVQNDFDGDGKVDIAAWHLALNHGVWKGTWIIRQSHNNSTRTNILGTTGDIPVPALYRR
jgi:hypothetical protein